MAYSQENITTWLQRMSTGALDLNADNIGLAAATLAILPAPGPEPKPELPTGYLSPHFTLAEMVHSDTAEAQHLDNTPSPSALIELSDLCNHTLEKIRSICGGHPVVISSGYRSPAVNAAVGGVSNSAHLYGCAADIEIPAFGSVTDVCHALMPHLVDLEIDQLIDESGGGARWVHVGRAIPPLTVPRHELWTSANGVTTKGIA